MTTAIMTGIKRSTWRHHHTQLVGQSPFSGKVATSDQQDWRWQWTHEYAPMTRAQAAPLLAEIALAQRDGSCRVYDPDFYAALTGFTGAANVDGSGFTGTSINIQTSPVVASTLIAKAFDKIYIHNVAATEFQMFNLMSNVTTDASGKATIQIDCAYRGTLLSTQAIYFAINATGTTPFLVSRIVIWDESPTDEMGRSVITITGEELV